MKFFILMCVLAILVLREFTVSGTANIKTTTMKLRKRDVQPLAENKSLKHNVSLINCAATCSSDSSCKSLTYNQGTCSLYGKDYSEDDSQMESAVGSMYYSIYENPTEPTTGLPSTTKGPQFHVKILRSRFTKISWDEAQKRCENKGGSLVSILNEDIQNQVVDAMKDERVTVGSWIGLKGINRNNDFQWLEGTILRGVKMGTKADKPFQIWHPEYPNNSDKDSPVAILGSNWKENAYTWSDKKRDTELNAFACEFNM